MTMEPVVNNRNDADYPFRPNDVLLGRGSGPNRWKGNIRFREVVLNTFQDYLERSVQEQQGRLPLPGVERPTTFSSLDPFAKNQLARTVLRTIKGERGRFLQRMSKEEFERENVTSRTTIIHQEQEERKGGKKTSYLYAEAGEKKALEKIKQTFRFLTDQKQARRLSKVSEARRISDEAIKSSFTNPSGTVSTQDRATAADITSSSSQVIAPNVLYSLHGLPAAHGHGSNVLMSLLNQRTPRIIAPNGAFPFSAALGNVPPPANLASLLMPSSTGVPIVHGIDVSLRIQLEQKMRMEREAFLVSTLHAARKREDLLRQQIFPPPQRPLSNQELLELARHLTGDTFPSSLGGETNQHDKKNRNAPS
jgi:hypothetical protein